MTLQSESQLIMAAEKAGRKISPTSMTSHLEERSLRSSTSLCLFQSRAAMFTAPTRPANGTQRIKPRNKPRRSSLVSFSLYEDDSTRSRPQTSVSRPFLRPLRRTEIRFVSQEMVDIFGTSRAWPMEINRVISATSIEKK